MEFGGLTLDIPSTIFQPHDGLLMLAEEATRQLPMDGWFLDVGCGAGTVALYVADARPDSRVFGVDIDNAAIKAARNNAHHLGLTAVFRWSDAFSNVGGSWDAIALSVPWESEDEWDGTEPRIAYVDDHNVMARALIGARERLRPGGKLLVFANALFEKVLPAMGWTVEEVVENDENEVLVAHA